MRHLLILIMAGISLLGLAARAQELTIRSIFAEGGGITGRIPENIQWSPDGGKVSYFLQDEQGENAQLYFVDVATGKQAVLVASEKLAALAPPATKTKDDREKDNRLRYHIAPYHWAPDSRHILFDSNGSLWLYSLETGTAVALTASGDAAGDPKFSPDGKRLSYVRNHQLYVRPISGGAETALTPEKKEKEKDNGENLLNGEVDWVYAEELDVHSNYFWSPDGNKIVFLHMDETQVPTYPITDFIPEHPTVSQEKYPKVGDPNPEVRIGVVNSHGGGLRWIHLTDEKDVYIPRFGWVRDGVVWAMVLNRAQNRLDLYFADASSGKSRRVLSESSDTWIEMDDNFTLLKSGDKFLWPSWRDGHTHLYLYSFDKAQPLASEARLERQVTQGDFEVFSVESIDEASGTVFVTANPGDDRQRHLCAVRLNGGELQVITKDKPGTHETSFAPGAKYYTDHFSTLLDPPRLSLCRIGGSCNEFWQSKAIASYRLTPPQWVDFHAEDGTLLHGLLYLPPSNDKKVPVLMNPYGGPHGQVVRDDWSGSGLLFNEILMRDGIAVLQVDNRGMGGRGRKFTTALRHNFGEIELRDQLAALDQALEKFPQLDSSRMGWWGWSYGGYMTLFALTHSNRFKAGVAVAPVTDWRDYDSIYTERYEGLLSENAEGYKKSSPVNFAGHLHGHLLEVHGTSDDNVHMQNTMQMIDALIDAGKQYDLLLYPRKTHGIGGMAARTHLFTRIREHFRRELLQGAAQDPEEKAE